MAVQYSSKLKAIDSIESPKFPAAELSKIIDTLISNSEIKEILVSPQSNNDIPAEYEITYNRELLVPATKRSSMQFNKWTEYAISLRSKPRQYYAAYVWYRIRSLYVVEVRIDRFFELNSARQILFDPWTMLEEFPRENNKDYDIDKVGQQNK